MWTLGWGRWLTCGKMGQNPGNYLVNPKIAGKWIFIPLKMVLIGIDPYPCGKMGRFHEISGISWEFP
jgi:hypothetical protein